ncbi:MAG TPA: hypothetical protein VKT74_05055 [Gammaproteobacteria bacterium]|nr:hypothetical protein [Gammaproteobacteria bacterium]
MGIIRVGALFLAGIVVSSAASAAGLHGQVSLVSGDIQSSLADLTDTVVFYKPDSEVRVRPLGGDLTITMRGKSFVPHVLAITDGSTVRFANSDPILHNVFSTSSPNDFDMGLYGTGPGKTKTFDHTGLVRVYCNVHHEMFAYILVLDTPYFTTVHEDGSFDLGSIPPGPGELTVWNPRGEVWRQHLAGLSVDALSVQLKLTRNGVPAHFNKFGKPYDKNANPGY